jgi:hypothetical protein
MHEYVHRLQYNCRMLPVEMLVELSLLCGKPWKSISLWSLDLGYCSS